MMTTILNRYRRMNEWLDRPFVARTSDVLMLLLGAGYCGAILMGTALLFATWP